MQITKRYPLAGTQIGILTLPWIDGSAGLENEFSLPIEVEGERHIINVRRESSGFVICSFHTSVSDSTPVGEFKIGEGFGIAKFDLHWQPLLVNFERILGLSADHWEIG